MSKWPFDVNRVHQDGFVLKPLVAVLVFLLKKTSCTLFTTIFALSSSWIGLPKSHVNTRCKWDQSDSA